MIDISNVFLYFIIHTRRQTHQKAPFYSYIMTLHQHTISHMQTPYPLLQVHILTLMPAMWNAFDHGVIHRAKNQNIWQQTIWNIRDFSHKHDGRIDNKPYGGGPGMVMQYPPLDRCWQSVQRNQSQRPFLVQMDPSGTSLDYHVLQRLSKQPAVAILCGRYEGIDQRFTDQHVDLCVSVGSFVVSGGDLPAMLLLDALVRMLPGALGNADSAQQDSHCHHGMLDHPAYTRPKCSQGGVVPAVLTSGHAARIAAWQRKMQLGRTWMHHPQALIGQSLDEHDVDYLQAFMREQRTTT